jgi:hypothetical protein
MMKKILTIFLGIALVLPLYSQEADIETHDGGIGEEAGEYAAAEETADTEEKPASKPEKKKTDFARQIFEMGLDFGVGFDNGLAGLNDVLQKKVVIDLSKIAQNVPDNGAGLNFDLNFDLFMNVKNIHIGEGLWDFGFITNVDGGVNVNIPKSLFELIAEGNTEQHDFSGQISASGGIYTEIGLPASARYKVAGKTLYVGFKPAIYTPAVYVSPSSGISYHLYTDKNGKEGLFLDTEGGISVYTATSFENIEPMNFIIGPSGFDITLEGEYALFPYLDVGGSLSHIPFAPATLTNEMKMGMKPFSVELVGEDLISGGDPKIDELEFSDPVYNNDAKKEVHRPFRFDVYARYKPLNFAPFGSEFLVLRPNIGFSVNVNKGDEKGYFNAGLEISMNLINLFTLYLGSGYQEEVWRQRVGFALNLRAFELDLQAVFRDQTFEGCFNGRGFEVNLGMRFGW